MLACRDFVPRMRDEGGFFRQPEFEDFEQAVEAAGRWIESTGVEVVSVETVVLPNMHDSGEQGAADPSLRTSGEMSSSWHQFVRVWYRS